MPRTNDPLDMDCIAEIEISLNTPTKEKDIFCESLPEHEYSDNVDGVDLDRCDLISKVWTSSLQNAPRRQQIIAERIINNILFEAQVGNLSTRTPLEISKLLLTNW